jgi:leukotriene-A4 hydrolase
VSETLDTAAAMAMAWSKGDISVDQVPASEWAPKVVVHFINNLDGELPDDKLSELDRALGLSETGNAEIGRTWFIQVAARKHRAAYAAMETYLNRYGRTRLVAPVYTALSENGSDRELALQMFDRARSKYHPITVTKIEYAFEKSK